MPNYVFSHVHPVEFFSHRCPQLWFAAQGGTAADIDRLIKDGANKEAEDAVRAKW